MRILFMGTPEFSVPALECLLSSEHEVIGVVTQPDRPRGRRGVTRQSPVKERAVLAGIPLWQPERVRNEEFIRTVSELNPDAVVVSAFGQILPKKLLDIPRYGCLNIHASLLPRYRGAAPIQWAVINGEKETGITVMQMDPGLDTGDILRQQKISISDDETGDSLHDKLSVMGGPLLLQVLEEISAGTVIRTPQQGESCYAPMLSRETGDVDWTQSAAQIERLIRGLDSWPSAYTHWQGRIIKLWKAQPLPLSSSDISSDICPGTVISCDDGIQVMTGEGILKITQLQQEGRKRMDSDTYLRGAKLCPGDIFNHA